MWNDPYDWQRMADQGFILPLEGYIADGWMPNLKAVLTAYPDLIRDIGRRYRSNMPEQLWDDKTDSFKKQVRAQSSKTVYTNVDTPLEKGKDLTFRLMIAGG